MPIRTRRWNDPVEPDDGFRLLVCRYRPRALPKKDETWNLWFPDLGPSKELHAAYYGKTGPSLDWETYRQRYRDEMKARQRDITFLAEKVLAGATLTLLCSSACVDASHCHRTLLKELIEAEMARLAAQGKD